MVDHRPAMRQSSAPHPPPVSAHGRLQSLAADHAGHLRWLRARLSGQLADDEIEDVLQCAYARALTALSAPASRRPHFATPTQAASWLRRIALNHAHDVARASRGRVRAG